MKKEEEDIYVYINKLSSQKNEMRSDPTGFAA